MASIEWTDELVFSLLLWYKNHEFLWDSKARQQQQSQGRLAKMKCIAKWLVLESIVTEDENAATLKVLVTMVIQKFHGLRTHFGSELKKLAHRTCKDHAVKWRFFDAMLFIKDAIVSRTNNDCQYPCHNEERTQERVEDPNAAADSHSLTYEPESEQFSEASTSETTTHIDHFIPNSSSVISETSHQGDVGLLHNCMSTVIGRPKEDREDHFFRYCAESLRQMQPYYRERARAEINQAISSNLEKSNNATNLIIVPRRNGNKPYVRRANQIYTRSRVVRNPNVMIV